MKKTLLFLSLLALCLACSKSDPAPVAPTLTGTRWSAFNFKSVIDGSNVYQILKFNTATTMEIYSATEKTAIVGTPQPATYTYADPTVTISFNNQSTSGTVSGNTLRYGGKEYVKEP
ncbi:MAG: hypothetical protein JWP57_2058 [Spirosoma sp.]|nr:hypothetical protein [Spirosoma sp.]